MDIHTLVISDVIDGVMDVQSFDADGFTLVVATGVFSEPGVTGNRRVHYLIPTEPPGEELPELPPDLIEMLLDLARTGREDDFKWLARSAGVQPEEVEPLWMGTVNRLGGGII